ncbi:MAG: TonB-dependent receptor plug [Bacteroidota bacterium]|nr:TonB-dependent receptor plug [Bacteroidota bacterium]
MLRKASLSVLMICILQVLNAQTTNVIQGTVKDNKGLPVTGATIGVKGTTIGALSDAEGKFTIAAPADATTLKITYIGYKTREIDIAKGDFNVTMDEDIQGLDEVVVTAQAVRREQRSLGYSTTTVKSEELNEVSPNSALDALQGKVAGAQITNASGAPGGSTRVVLRGGSSLTGNNNALIVVDGVPIDNSNFGFGDALKNNDILNNQYDAGNRGNDINPQDIESVTVLKGAAAVALYGQRGANGAILYTTKSGKDVVRSGKKFKVSLSTNVTVETPLKLPKMQNEFGQGTEDNNGTPFFDAAQNWSWGPKLDGSLQPWGTPVNGQIRVKPYSAVPNNVGSFFNVGATYNNTVAISGGDKGTSFYTSFNNVKYDGIVPTTGYQRNSLRLNVTHDFSDALSVTGNFNYTKTNSQLPVGSQGNQGVYNTLLNTPVDIPIRDGRDLSSPFNQPGNYYDHYYTNPYWVLANEKTTDNVDRFMNNVSVNYKPIKWLSFTGRFGADIYTDTREQKFLKYDFISSGYLSSNYQGPPDEFPVTYRGKYSQDLYRVNNINGDLMATFNKEFKHDLALTAMVGFNAYSNTIRNTYVETSGLVIPDQYSINNSLDRPTVLDQTFTNRILGVYADVDLSYKNFFFIDLTARNDWSSTLPVDHRSYFYPGVSTSLVFTDIPKKKINPMILSYGKVRASIAQIGKDASAYQLKNYFVGGDVSDLFLNTNIKTPYYSPAASNIPGYALSTTMANPNLKPEISTTWEAGLDLSFLKDRLSVEFTYYWKRSINEIMIIPVAPSSGYTDQVVNAGILSNQGVELAFRGVPVSTKSGFKWEIFGTFTKNYSKVIKVADNTTQITLPNTASNITEVAQVGQPYGSFYGTAAKTDGNGHVVVDSASGLPIPTAQAQILGNYQPDWLGSIGTSFSYKGFKFTILLDGRMGGQVYSNTAELQMFLGNDPKTTYNDRNPFVVPNSVYMNSEGQYVTNTTKVAPYNYWGATLSSLQFPQYSLVSASFMKIREISVSYSIPAKALKKTRYITGLTVKVFGNNLAMWVPKSNTYIDPEVNSSGAGNTQGYEFLNLPSLRSAGAGVNLDF